MWLCIRRATAPRNGLRPCCRLSSLECLGGFLGIPVREFLVLILTSCVWVTSRTHLRRGPSMSLLARFLARLPRALPGALAVDEREFRNKEVLPLMAPTPERHAPVSSYRLVGRRRAEWSTCTEEVLLTSWVPLFLLWLRTALGSRRCMVPSDAWSLASRATPPPRWAADPWVLRVCAVAAVLATTQPPTDEMIQRLVGIRDLLPIWLRPPGRRARPAVRPVPRFLWHLCGWCLFIAVTRRQAHGGVCERATAQRRLV